MRTLLILLSLALSLWSQNWLQWNKWDPRGEFIPTLGGALKLLVSPEAQILSPNDLKYTNLSLGTNLVDNGDFHDFTFDVDANTVALWIFDDVYHTNEATGKQVIQDLAGNHDLTISGWIDYNDLLSDMTGTNPAYQDGRALNFPGVNEYLKIPYDNAGGLNPGTGSFTIELWYRSTIVNKSFITKKGGITTGAGYYLSVDSAGLFRPRIQDDLGNGVDAPADGTRINDGNWHHIVLVVDRTQNTMTRYIDGQISGAVTDISTVTGSLNNNNDFFIGLSIIGGGGYLQGEIAAVRFSNVARTAQEIKESYGLAKGWTWHNNVGGTFYNNSFQQYISTINFSEGLKYNAPTTPGQLYKFEGDVTYISGDEPRTWDNQTGRTDYYSDMNVGETKHFIRYFKASSSSVTIHLKHNGAGESRWDNISIRPVLNANWSGTTVLDYSGNSNNGTMQGLMEQDQPSHPAAFALDGISQYVNFGDVCDVGTNDFILAWWDNGDISQNQDVFRKYDGTAVKGYIVRKLTTGAIEITLADGTATTLSSAANTIQSGWNFYAIIFDRDVGAKIYRNGSFLEIISGFTARSGSLNNTTNLYVGGNVSYFKDLLGIIPIYIFDGQNGAPSFVNEINLDWLMSKLYNNTKPIYLN